ncbi:Protein of unknown function, partial [Gryllus bimaculatus]
MRTTVVMTVLLGVAARALIAETQGKNLHTLAFGYSAQRQKSGIWNFLVKSAGNVSWKEKPMMGVDVKITETGDPNDGLKGSWIEMTSGISVSSSGPAPPKLPEPLFTALHEVKKWPVPSDYTRIAGLGYYK